MILELLSEKSALKTHAKNYKSRKMDLRSGGPGRLHPIK
jgi:hypothetical protein